MAIEKIVKGNAISSASELRCQSSVQKGVSWSMPSLDRTWWKFCDKLTEWKNHPLNIWRMASQQKITFSVFFSVCFVMSKTYTLINSWFKFEWAWLCGGRLLVLKLIFYETRWTPLAKRNLDVPGWVSRQDLLRIADWTEQALLYWSALIKTDILIKTDPIIFEFNMCRPSYIITKH